MFIVDKLSNDAKFGIALHVGPLFPKKSTHLGKYQYSIETLIWLSLAAEVGRGSRSGAVLGFISSEIVYNGLVKRVVLW